MKRIITYAIVLPVFIPTVLIVCVSLGFGLIVMWAMDELYAG